ncbi:MAG: hypothetical protein HYY32_00785 [Chloroflexi bacterium]|nr:hypothetical protein [Chloroflexota bacterium]
MEGEREGEMDGAGVGAVVAVAEGEGEEEGGREAKGEELVEGAVETGGEAAGPAHAATESRASMHSRHMALGFMDIRSWLTLLLLVYQHRPGTTHVWWRGRPCLRASPGNDFDFVRNRALLLGAACRAPTRRMRVGRRRARPLRR